MVVNVAEIVYLMVPILALFLLAVWGATLVMKQSRRRSVVRRYAKWAVLAASVSWGLSAVVLSHYTTLLHEFRFGDAETKTEVLQKIGWPTDIGKPHVAWWDRGGVLEASLWYYHVDVPAFEVDLRLEFEGDKLTGVTRVKSK